MVDVEKGYQELIAKLKEKGNDDTDLVAKAFLLASKLHKNQTRLGGEPYITHPLAVAKILASQNFDADVICAALLHDVVEDCGYSIEAMEQEFNQNIAEIVGAVTAIEQKDYEKNDESIFEDSDFKKFSLEEQTYKKLLSLGKKNRLAFYIKFADRLHNLSTINVFDEYKQIEKVRETEKWIMPIAELMKSQYFYSRLKNNCFLIENQKNIVNFNEIIERYYKLNENNYQKIKNNLFYVLEKYFSKLKSKTSISEIKFEKSTALCLFERISKVIGIKKVHEVKQSYMNKVPTCDIYVIVYSNISQKKLNETLFYILDQKLIENLKIINYQVDNQFINEYFIVQDDIKNKYRITVMNSKDYSLYKMGSIEGVDIEYIDEDVSNEIETDYISCRTRSGEVLKLPGGATVLDFAFKLHKDLGFACKYAIINDAPTRYPLYTKLKDGDKINLIVEKDNETGLLRNIAKIRWLAYVKTEPVQRVLIRYFEKQQS